MNRVPLVCEVHGIFVSELMRVILLYLLSLCYYSIMDFFLCLAGELVEEEGYTCKEHHNTMNDSVEEQKENLCIYALLYT